MERIKLKMHLSLPKGYIDFLVNHEDNIIVEIDGEEIEVFGINGLFEGQEGYSYNPLDNTLIEGWNPDYVVIATCNSDPYCINTSLENSPVYYAVHGEGEWNFEKDSESLEEFYKKIKIN